MTLTLLMKCAAWRNHIQNLRHHSVNTETLNLFDLCYVTLRKHFTLFCRSFTSEGLFTIQVPSPVPCLPPPPPPPPGRGASGPVSSLKCPRDPAFPLGTKQTNPRLRAVHIKQTLLPVNRWAALRNNPGKPELRMGCSTEAPKSHTHSSPAGRRPHARPRSFLSHVTTSLPSPSANIMIHPPVMGTEEHQWSLFVSQWEDVCTVLLKWKPPLSLHMMPSSFSQLLPATSCQSHVIDSWDLSCVCIAEGRDVLLPLWPHKVKWSLYTGQM